MNGSNRPNQAKKWTVSALLCAVTSLGIGMSAGIAAAENSPPELYQEYPQPGEAQAFAGYAKEINEIQTRLAKGQPIERALHSKAHGCLQGTFKVLATLPDDMKYGVLVPGAEYPVVGRFSNASGTPKSDKKSDMRGFAMKLTGTPGVASQDFLMTNGPVHFAKDAREMMEFADAGSRGLLAMGGYFVKHPKAAIILLKDISHKVVSMATESYWSRVPFKIGPKAMKFNVTPCADDQATDKLLDPKHKAPTYLTDDLRERASQGPICFNFNIQMQKDAIRQPIEDATVEWKEEDTPSITVAQVVFPAQTFDSTEQMQACNDMAFDPWNHHPDFRPIGNMNRARQVVYPSSQWLRGAK
jgi:catalase